MVLSTIFPAAAYGEIGKNPRGTAPQCILISET
jgi:hypothetical protein